MTQFCDYLKSKYSSLSEEEKVKLVYRWITKNIKYDKDGDVERDPEKFFESKTKVCSGFARLFKKLLISMDYNEENILNIYVYTKGVDYNVNIYYLMPPMNGMLLNLIMNGVYLMLLGIHKKPIIVIFARDLLVL